MKNLKNLKLNAAGWIAQIKDKTVKIYLTENVEKFAKPEHTVDTIYVGMHSFISYSFDWDKTPQGGTFWGAIVEHFALGSGIKTYDDFKHLDKSIEQTEEDNGTIVSISDLEDGVVKGVTVEEKKITELVPGDIHYAQNKEDLGICNFISQLINANVPKSFQFLDIGANDGVTFSNTRLLAQKFPQYTGFFVEPHPEAFKRLVEVYKDDFTNHKFFNYAIGDKDGSTTMYLNGSHLKTGDVGLLSTLIDTEKERWKDTEQWEEVQVDVKAYPFSNEKFDFISIDAEGYDEAILRQIDLSHTYLLCIEWNSKLDVRERISEYCAKFGLQQYFQSTENLVFIRV